MITSCGATKDSAGAIPILRKTRSEFVRPVMSSFSLQAGV